VLDLGYVKSRPRECPTARGYELTLELPLFDWGGARVARAEGVYMQAVQRVAQAPVDGAQRGARELSRLPQRLRPGRPLPRPHHPAAQADLAGGPAALQRHAVVSPRNCCRFARAGRRGVGYIDALKSSGPRTRSWRPRSACASPQRQHGNTRNTQNDIPQEFPLGGAGAAMAAPRWSARPRRRHPRSPGPVVRRHRAAACPPNGRPYNPVVTLNGWTLPWRMKDGVKEFHLVAEPVVREIAPGMKANLWGYNGQSPGPTIEVVEGDRVRIFVTNKLPEKHQHPLARPDPAERDGRRGGPDPAGIAPGKTFVYEFVARYAGTFMYHPHADEMAQIGMGMMGFWVTHPKDPRQHAVDRDFVFLLNAYDIEPGQLHAEREHHARL
jgi:hypothetical protein